MLSKNFYDELDNGIRFPVKVLHAAMIDTCQSCQGGQGHPYDRPTIDLPLGDDNTIVFAALSALWAYGLPIWQVEIVWRIGNDGTPFEKLGRLTFYKTMENRADDNPTFINSYQTQVN
jgi:hypothetical protein